MEEDVRYILSQIQMERIELKSTLKEISFIMKTNQGINLSREINGVLDRLKYLDVLEKEIRKRL